MELKFSYNFCAQEIQRGEFIFHKNIELMLRLMLQRRVVRYTILTEMLQSHFLAIEQSRKQKTYVGRKYVLACCTIPTRKNFQHIFFAPLVSLTYFFVPPLLHYSCGTRSR